MKRPIAVNMVFHKLMLIFSSTIISNNHKNRWMNAYISSKITKKILVTLLIWLESIVSTKSIAETSQ